MTENDRVKEIRKAKTFTQEEFGKALGISRAAIANIESGNRSVTEQTRRSICREFGVNETWLRTGEGEMFLSTESQHLENIYQRYNLTPEDRIIMEEFLALRPEVRREILDCVIRVADRLRQQEDFQLERDAAEIARQLREEKEQTDTSSASQDTDSDTKMA